MSKVKEISEEKFLVLGELGMPVYWDIPPFYSCHRIAQDLTTVRDSYYPRYLSHTDYIRDKEGLINGVRFYTLVGEE